MTTKNSFRIGWAETDITPRNTCELTGQYYQRISKGIHSRLSATVLALKSDSGEQAIMISTDLISIPLDLLNTLRQRIRNKFPEIETQKIILNAIHTHNAPGLKDKLSLWKKPPPNILKTEDYRDFLTEALTNAVQQAWADLKPGAISLKTAHATIGHCRRAVFQNNRAEMYGDTSRNDFTGMEGTEDSCLELMFTYNHHKKLTGAIVNVACPSQIMEATYLISSDFMGEMRRLLQKRFGKNFKILCQISAAGDQSPRDLIRNRNADLWNARGVAMTGKCLAESIITAADKIPSAAIINRAAMNHKIRAVILPKRFPSTIELKRAKRELARLQAIMPIKKAFAAFDAEVRRNEKIPNRPGPYDSKLHHFVLIKNADAVIQRAKERATAPDYAMELHVLRLGPAAFCTNPFELFLDYGQCIKARSRASQTFVIQLACGTAGYLPTAIAEKHGGYGGLIINGVIGAKGGAKLVEETLHDLNAMF